MLAFDNMCQLDSMKVAQKPLPMEPPMYMINVVKHSKGNYVCT